MPPSPTARLAVMPVRPRGRILFSLLLLLLAVSVVPLVGTSWRLVSGSRDMLEFDEKRLQHAKAGALAQQASVFVSSLQGRVRAIARTLDMDGGVDFSSRMQRLRQTPAALESFLTEDSPFQAVSVVDASGEGVRAGIRFAEPGLDRLVESAVENALAGHPTISSPLVSQALKEPVVVLAEPVRPGGGVVQGVVLVVSSLQPLWRMARDMDEGGLMDIYVVDAAGRLIAHSDPRRLGSDVTGIEVVRQFLATRGRTAATMPFVLASEQGPVEMMGTYLGVPQVGWGVIVQREESKAYQEVYRLRDQSFLLVGAVTLLAGLLGSLFARQITRPIQDLAESALRFAAGEYATRVPVRSGNEVGVLSATFNRMGEEIQRSIEEIRRAAETNRELFLGSIRMLANAIDEKDPYTRGHSERVAYYSAVMAKHLGMSQEEVDKVHLSGIIHDVGKIGIEDKILRKASALTDDEYEIMKQHPAKGLHILEAVPLLKKMAGAGLMHHENWDGTGYPDGLREEGIPMLGRIVSVADAFDAMTTDRPYSKAMTFEDALKRVRVLAGKKFDPICVEAIEKAAAAGDLTPAKARRAAVEARKNPVRVEAQA